LGQLPSHRRSTPWQSAYAVVRQPGERIAYEVHRGSGGPPLVLLHGFTASKASFVSNVASLSEQFTVITVELLGHGDSEAPADPAAYAAPVAIERILDLLDHLGYERVLLCGHSLGGAVALRLALDAPDRLAGWSDQFELAANTRPASRPSGDGGDGQAGAGRGTVSSGTRSTRRTAGARPEAKTS
jgi:alpha-beta hydrolase superfamily lysophospholipase